MTPESKPLLESGADPDPLGQFGQWFDEAAAVVPHPEAMAVATADSQGHPSVRMVLLKGWDANGFVFYTNFDSRKGRELGDNPYAALLFHWELLGRQVRIEGPVDRIPERDSDSYFQTRPRGGQIGARASYQSRSIESREELDREVKILEGQFAGQEVPRPPWWGGLRVQPRVFEFWQNREDRLHDRLRYTPVADGWKIDRLQP
ncbi:MAG TPA: pyridoxamine 5'-phosphate oxidase [Acidimicrobiales bacterium]|jgi:pyridoxamine 5'-phosphate oxidase|nr:pyridoxamine 5'-phosphate oxidase [Acidimicrobiales bacterium]